jgi:hypothetical protein
MATRLGLQCTVRAFHAYRVVSIQYGMASLPSTNGSAPLMTQTCGLVCTVCVFRNLSVERLARAFSYHISIRARRFHRSRPVTVLVTWLGLRPTQASSTRKQVQTQSSRKAAALSAPLAALHKQQERMLSISMYMSFPFSVRAYIASYPWLARDFFYRYSANFSISNSLL